MDDCLFCKIANGEIASEFLYEDDEFVAFSDINPIAPIHILIIPKTHIASADDIDEKNSYLIGKIFTIASQLAKDMGLKKGYRIVNNCKEDGGQSVDHIHFHLLGGRQMLWPPG
ncbi:histidine triad nucleotide-binding protein [Tissierella creatinophila]|uniref:HIT-like protein n=1 Tax=Tissierella creatinophila DSM 6911 TaxID=1123403 RepID=A0A1U7M7T8_TISCR|nr:histidine triad nucleotide-binding protein [Tissierella creatinophila]OLS03382.1 HIT-like protein [Tissierella creatinophila DSM 6911]